MKLKRNKIHIFIFTQTLLKGGAEKQAILLSNVLTSEFNTSLIVYYGEKIDDSLKHILNENKSITIIKLKGSHIFKFLYLVKLFFKNKGAILFNYLLLPNFIGGILSQITPIKASIGGVRSSVLVGYKSPVERFINNKLNTFTIFNNKVGLTKCVNEGFNEKKCFYIPNALFPIPGKIDKSTNREDITILSVGRFEKIKNYPFALSIVNELIKKDINLKYIIVGWGSEEKTIRQLVANYGIEDFVDVVINPPSVNDYYLKADMFLQTSNFEGLSNTIMEAMSFSLPVIATNVGDNSELVKNDVTGYLIDSSEICFFVENIINLISNPDKRILFGKNAYDRIVENYSLHRFKENYLRFLEEKVFYEA